MMKTEFRFYILIIVAALGLFLIVIIIPTLQNADLPNSAPASSLPEIGTPTDTWSSLLLMTPVPYTTSLPNEAWTPIDGTYAKLDLSDPLWWACRRCADYRPAGGIWKLQFNKGVMRIHYGVTGWRSIASYTVSDDHLYLFNDPYCTQEVGEYKWRLEDKWNLDDRVLVLDVVNDSCSINLRGENLSDIPWQSCQPPNLMTGASDHWHKTPGCETEVKPPAAPPPSTLDATVIVHPGYVREYAVQPDLYVIANKDEVFPPDGITLAHSDDSISYGTNRVLWGARSWVKATTELPFDAMGVQIYGAPTIGWARVLFDGQEIWRGNTAEIWAHKGWHGGYIEVSGFHPGSHTLRIESMGFDYHPVTIAFFGFSEESGVEAGQE